MNSRKRLFFREKDYCILISYRRQLLCEFRHFCLLVQLGLHSLPAIFS